VIEHYAVTVLNKASYLERLKKTPCKLEKTGENNTFVPLKINKE
jgi:hypothetical protein